MSKQEVDEYLSLFGLFLIWIFGFWFGYWVFGYSDEKEYCKDYGIMNNVETVWLESKDVCWDKTDGEVVKDE